MDPAHDSPVGLRLAGEMNHQVERGGKDLSHDRFGHVLTGHERRAHDCVEGVARRVGVHRAQEPAPGVDRSRELESFGASHLAHDDPVGPHCQSDHDAVAVPLVERPCP